MHSIKHSITNLSRFIRLLSRRKQTVSVVTGSLKQKDVLPPPQFTWLFAQARSLRKKFVICGVKQALDILCAINPITKGFKVELFLKIKDQFLLRQTKEENETNEVTYYASMN